MREFSDNVIRAAKKLVDQERVEPDEKYPEAWWVRGEGGRYRVLVDPIHDPPEWITCTCPHGTKKGAGDVRCKHGAAVLMVIKDG